jgi:aromatic ring-cleaving dioxygenase
MSEFFTIIRILQLLCVPCIFFVVHFVMYALCVFVLLCVLGVNAHGPPREFRLHQGPLYRTEMEKLKLQDLFVPPKPGQSSVDYHPQLKQLPGDDEPLVYYSWHIHVYFYQDNRNYSAECMAFREEFILAFNVPKCTGDCFMGGPFDTCTQGFSSFCSFFLLPLFFFSFSFLIRLLLLGMCVWDPVFGVDGPHPYGQWGVYLPNENLAETLSWMSLNHRQFLVLFHPNTGYMVGGKLFSSFPSTEAI